MNAGDILILKITGERVMILNPSVPVAGGETMVFVRRATISESQGISHQGEHFFAYELESPEQHLTSELAEMKLKHTLQSKFQKEMEDEEREQTRKEAETAIEKLTVN